MTILDILIKESHEAFTSVYKNVGAVTLTALKSDH